MRLSDFKLLAPDRPRPTTSNSHDEFHQGMERDARAIARVRCGGRAAVAAAPVRPGDRRHGCWRRSSACWCCTRSSSCCRRRSTWATRTCARPPHTVSATSSRCGHYAAILGNTVVVSLAATAMAIIFGFVTAWILSRTDVPFRRTLEQLMAVPYYVTPLLGALRLEHAGRAGKRLHQPVLARARRPGRADRHGHPVRHRLGDGAVRGLGRLLHDRRGDEVDGPVAGGSLPGDGRQPPAHHAASHPAAGRPRRAGRDDLRVRRDARLVHRGTGARAAQPLLRGDHGDLPAGFAIPAAPAAGRRDGRVAVRR